MHPVTGAGAGTVVAVRIADADREQEINHQYRSLTQHRLTGLPLNEMAGRRR
jgi:hypothetical protein